MKKIFRLYDDTRSLFAVAESIHHAEQIGRSIGLTDPVARYVVTSADPSKTIARLTITNELRERTRNK